MELRTGDKVVPSKELDLKNYIYTVTTTYMGFISVEGIDRWWHESLWSKQTGFSLGELE